MTTKTKSLIKAIFLFGFIFFLLSATFGQAKETPFTKIYFEAGIGAAGKKGFVSNLGVQAVIKNSWTASVSYSSLDMEPNNTPSDYHPGYLIVLFFPIKEEKPSVDMKLLSFNIGKFYKAGRRPWFTTEAGLSFVSGKKMEFSKNPDNQATWLIIAGEQPSNYTYTEEKNTTMGAMLKADFNWAFSSFAGLGAGAFANLNSIQSPVGFQIKLILGKMNREKKA
jgi:hypothetical protein